MFSLFILLYTPNYIEKKRPSRPTGIKILLNNALPWNFN